MPLICSCIVGGNEAEDGTMGGLCDGGILILRGAGLMDSTLPKSLLGDVRKTSAWYMSDNGGQC